MHLQEWAASNQVTVPHKENRVNAAALYKGGDEETPNNILQVGKASHSIPSMNVQYLRKYRLIMCDALCSLKFSSWVQQSSYFSRCMLAFL